MKISLAVLIFLLPSLAAFAETSQEAFDRLMSKGPCPTMPQVPCVDRMAGWRDAGDPLAKLLIEKYEAARVVGDPGAHRYLRYAALTDTPRIRTYLAERVEAEEDPKLVCGILEAMARIEGDNDLRARAKRIYVRFDEPEVRRRAVNAVSWNLQGRPTQGKSKKLAASMATAEELQWLGDVSRNDPDISVRTRALKEANRRR